MKVLTIVGARPQFIKASAVSRAIVDGGQIDEVLVHTGQHFDDGMSAVFFRELGLRAPDYHLEVNGGSHGQMTGRMVERIDAVIESERPGAVLVYGDTNSTLAGALAAAKLAVPVVHVEAGLRSFKRTMPEEINRVVTDHVSALLCCPTRIAVDNLRREGFTNVLGDGELTDGAIPASAGPGPWVANVGDVMLDVLLRYRATAARQSAVLGRLGLGERQYAVLTIHRAANTADIEALRALLRPIVELSRKLPVVFVVHPRTDALMREAGDLPDLAGRAGMILTNPLSYLDFLQLQANARVILTDSGGVQKESLFLGVPCLTLRDETEWPETVEAGWNRLVGCCPGDLWRAIEDAPKPSDPVTDPFGKGDASVRIVRFICAALMQ